MPGRPRSPEKTIDPFLAALGLLDAEPDDRGTQDVAGIDECGVDAGRDLDLLAVVQSLERRQGVLGVLGRVERRVEVDLEVRRLGPQLGLRVARPGARRRCRFDGRGDVLGFLVPGGRGGDVGGGRGGRGGGGGTLDGPRLARSGQVDSRLVLVGFTLVVRDDLVGVALLPARLALGELLVELARVEQDERGQLDGAGGGVDRSFVPVLDQQRQQAAVVEMGMGQQHGVEIGRIEGERDAVADRFVRAALEHPAIDEDLGPLGDEQVLRAGDGRRAAEEGDLHGRMVTAQGPCRRILRAHEHHERRTVLRRTPGRVRRSRGRTDPRCSAG